MISKSFANSQPSAFKSFSRSLEHFFLTVGQNKFGNKIPFFFTGYILNLRLLSAFSEPKMCKDCLFIEFYYITSFAKTWLTEPTQNFFNSTSLKDQIWKKWKSLMKLYEEVHFLHKSCKNRLCFLVPRTFFDKNMVHGAYKINPLFIYITTINDQILKKYLMKS